MTAGQTLSYVEMQSQLKTYRPIYRFSSLNPLFPEIKELISVVCNNNVDCCRKILSLNSNKVHTFTLAHCNHCASVDVSFRYCNCRVFNVNASDNLFILMMSADNSDNKSVQVGNCLVCFQTIFTYCSTTTMFTQGITSVTKKWPAWTPGKFHKEMFYTGWL